MTARIVGSNHNNNLGTHAEELESFEAWLAMDEMSTTMFMVEEMPALNRQAYSLESLKALGQELVTRFSSYEEALRDESSRQFFDRAVSYFAQYYIRHLEGEWVLWEGDRGLTPAVYLPFRRELGVNPILDLRTNIERGDANGLSKVAMYAKEDYDTWVASGRPTKPLAN